MKTICVCSFCGEQWLGHPTADVKCPLYCKDCRTEKARELIKQANEQIKSEAKVA